MSYPLFKDMDFRTKVRAKRDIAFKNRTMKAGETGTITRRYAYLVEVTPDGKKLGLETNCEDDLEAIDT
jgi:hypothetical protein